MRWTLLLKLLKMNRNLCLNYILGLLFLSSLVSAQHCPFDGAYIFVVEPHGEMDEGVVKGLRISFADSNGLRLVDSYWRENEWQDDTIYMWQNPDSTTHSGIIDNMNPMNPWTIRFWFAERNYVFVSGGLPYNAHNLVIEDPKGRYQTQTLSLAEVEVFPLCTGQSNWNWGPEGGFVAEYQTLKLNLKALR